MFSSRFAGTWRHWLACLALLAAPAWVGAQPADPPDRVLYLSAQEGPARMAADGVNWTDIGLNWPIVAGARVAADGGTRLELDGGWVVLRTAGPSDLGITQLDDQNTQVALTRGGLSVRVR